MKRVLLIDYAKYTGADGQAIYNYKLIKIFKELGWDITHFSFAINNHLLDISPKFSDVHEIKSDYYNNHEFKPLSIMRLLKIQKYGMKQLVKHLNNNQYDLIIDSIQFTWGFAKNLPLDNRIWIQHQSCSVLDYSQLFGRTWNKFFYKFVKLFRKYFANIEIVRNAVVYTRYDLDQLKLSFPNKISKFWMIPLSDNVNEKIKLIPYVDRKKALLFVGRLDLHQKRINFLIELSKYLNVDIHVYGNGDLLDKINKNPNRIKYMGVFKKEQVHDIYSQYLFTILVSKFEGFSFVLVESLCNGTPIITVDSFDSAKFLVDNEKNGHLLNYSDGAMKMANDINRYINNVANNNDYNNLTTNSYNFAKQILSDDLFYKNWTSLIKEWEK